MIEVLVTIVILVIGLLGLQDCKHGATSKWRPTSVLALIC
jgi:Tfp pilus assembly protein PilV